MNNRTTLAKSKHLQITPGYTVYNCPIPPCWCCFLLTGHWQTWVWHTYIGQQRIHVESSRWSYLSRQHSVLTFDSGMTRCRPASAPCMTRHHFRHNHIAGLCLDTFFFNAWRVLFGTSPISCPDSSVSCISLWACAHSHISRITQMGRFKSCETLFTLPKDTVKVRKSKRFYGHDMTLVRVLEIICLLLLNLCLASGCTLDQSPLLSRLFYNVDIINVVTLISATFPSVQLCGFPIFLASSPKQKRHKIAFSQESLVCVSIQ